MKKALHRFGAVVLGLIVAVLLMEFGVRILVVWRYRGWPQMLTNDTPTDPAVTLTFGQMLVRDPDPEIIYRMKPGLKGRFVGAEVELNSLGVRSAEIRVERTSDTLRIVSLGDSSMFGWGVPREASYMELAREELERSFGGPRRVELLNMAVPSYMTVQEVALYRETGRKFNPDIVVIQHDLNDAFIAFFLLKPNLLDLRHLYLADLADLMRGTLLEPEGLVARHPNLAVPAEFRHLNGWERMRRAYEELAQICREDGSDLLVVLPAHHVHPDTPGGSDPAYDPIRNMLSELGIRWLDTYPGTVRMARELELSSEDFMVVPGEDLHPSELRHRIMAAQIWREIARWHGGSLIPKDAIDSRFRELTQSIRRDLGHRGFHAASDWNGLTVRWSQAEAGLVLDLKNGEGRIGYSVQHPDISPLHPVEVTITPRGQEPNRRMHTAKGYVLERIANPSGGDGWIPVEITVSRTFEESPGGRRLGIAVYDNPPDEQTR